MLSFLSEVGLQRSTIKVWEWQAFRRNLVIFQTWKNWTVNQSRNSLLFHINKRKKNLVEKCASEKKTAVLGKRFIFIRSSTYLPTSSSSSSSSSFSSAFPQEKDTKKEKEKGFSLARKQKGKRGEEQLLIMSFYEKEGEEEGRGLSKKASSFYLGRFHGKLRKLSRKVMILLRRKSFPPPFP